MLQVPHMLDALAKLINAGLPSICHTIEWPLCCLQKHTLGCCSMTATPDAGQCCSKLCATFPPAGQLKIAYTEYSLDEFAEALDHALDEGKNSKIVLRMPECSIDQWQDSRP
jgi:hypothetical protein